MSTGDDHFIFPRIGPLSESFPRRRYELFMNDKFAHDVGIHLEPETKPRRRHRQEPLPDGWHDGGSQIRGTLAVLDRLLTMERDAHAETRRKSAEKIRMWQLVAALVTGFLVLLIVFGKVR